jgi:hypothetical protein
MRYAETAFPFVMNDRIVIPAGTYVQERSRTPSCGAVEETRRNSSPFYVDDLSDRLYGDAAASVEALEERHQQREGCEGTIQADKDTSEG